MAENRGSIQIADNIRWPNGKHPRKFKAKVGKSADKLTHGRVLAVDPASGSSSMPGWAMFEAGEMVASGTVKLKKSAPIQQRLNDLFFALSQGVGHPPPDIVVLEEIRGRMAHAFLLWACGVTASAFPESDLIELPISFWKAVVPEDYDKDDETDAVYIGLAAIMVAKECTNESDDS